MSKVYKMCIKSIKWLFSSILLGVCLLLSSGQEAEAQLYTDSLTFKIDSSKIEGEFLTYSVMFWRTNKDWRGGEAVISGIQDTTLGNTDLYFWLEDVVFDKLATPMIERHHPNVDVPQTNPWDLPGTNLLEITTRYYARRFSISLKTKTTGLDNSMGVVQIPYNIPTELCRVKIRMSNPAQNPGLSWDEDATGGQSTIGEPLILSYEGDILMNPSKDIVLVDYSKTNYVCEGGEAKVWAKGHSAGTKLKIAWYMSDKPDCINQYNAGNGAKFYSNIEGNIVSGQVHVLDNVNTPWGNLSYRITCANDGLERVDTLHIQSVPLSLDSMYFQCELSDATAGSLPRTSVNGNTAATRTQLLIRERVWGWFATSFVSKRDDYLTTGIGASDRTDTVMKCPAAGAILSFYFFGPKCNTDKEVIGNKMIVNYMWRDVLGNAGEGNASVTTWQKESDETISPNGGCLYRGTVLTPDSVTDKMIWIKSIETEKGCLNGASYAKYDTVYIQDIPQNQSYVAAITDTTISAGESFVLLNPGFSYELKQPALGTINHGAKTYTAPATSCSDPKGCSDTIIYTYNLPNGDGTTCKMELQQVVNLGALYYLSGKVLLEGGFVFSSSSDMYSDLSAVLKRNDGGHFMSPYSKETCAALPNIGGKIIDWIYVELRDASNVGNLLQVVDTVSAFLREDGMIYSMEGKPYLAFKNLPKKDYYVIIEHRNHIGTMSNSAVTLKTSSTDAISTILIDFTIPASNYINMGVSSILPYVVLRDGRAALHLGDVDEDGMIGLSDANKVLTNQASGTLSKFDINFDIDVNIADYNKTQGKFSAGNPVQHY